MRRAVLLLGALAAAAGIVGHFTHAGSEAGDATEDPAGGGAAGEAPTLRGAAGGEQGPEDPWDPRTFAVAAATAQAGLARRVAALAARDPEAVRRLARDLVEALRQRYDDERRTVGAPRHAIWPGSIVEALRLLGPAGAEARAEVLGDPDESLRIRAAWALGELRDLAVPHVPAMAARARVAGDAPHVRAAVIRALAVLGPHAAEIGPDLVAWARDDATPEHLAEATAGALLPVCGASEEALRAARTVLARQAFDPCLALLPTVRTRAAEAASLAPDLLELLATVQQDGPVEREALGVLGAITSDDPEAHRFLLATFEDESRRDSVRRHAAGVLGRSGASGRKTLLASAARAGDEARLLAFDVLVEEAPSPYDLPEGSPLPPAPPLPDDLRDLLFPLVDARDEDVSRQAVDRLAPHLAGSDLDHVLGRFLEETRSPDARTRHGALWRLAALREPRREALAANLRLLRDHVPYVRLAAVETLLRHAPADEPAALEALVGLLRDPDPGVRHEALDALPTFAARHRDQVLAALDGATSDPDPTVARQAEHWRTALRRPK